MSLPEKCPLCAASYHDQVVVTPHVFGNDSNISRAFFHCETCDVRYQYPGLSPKQETDFYAAEFEGFMATRSGSDGGWHKAEEHIAANEATRVRRMKYLSHHVVENSNLLEVGCSSGFMLYPFSEQGHDCSGVEPSGLFSEYVKSRGLEVYPSLSDLHNNNESLRFDVILHFFVLEHIADPLAFLKSQLDLLKPGGKIILEIPNAADPLYSVYDIPNFERFYWSIAHPWYFSAASLNYLLSQLGVSYEVQLDQRYDLSNHMVWAKDGRPGGMNRFTNKLGADVEESYKQGLIKSGNCDTLIGIINKG
jgi:SAM-dependent methyltransferase